MKAGGTRERLGVGCGTSRTRRTANSRGALSVVILDKPRTGSSALDWVVDKYALDGLHTGRCPLECFRTQTESHSFLSVSLRDALSRAFLVVEWSWWMSSLLMTHTTGLVSEQ